MRPRSNISATLRNKRHASFRKKIFAYFIFALFFISLGVLGLTTNEVRIKEVKVSGNPSVLTEDIVNAANTEINKYYFWIIPTDNILLLRRTEIQNDILNNIKEIGSVKILINGINKIEIEVMERESKNLWCKGVPINIGNCYFMDSDGFVFEEAPTFSANAFPEYFGLIADENPIGKYYFKDNFKNISNLYNMFKKISFEPKYFNALDEHEYEIYISGGGKIFINDGRSFESELVNLQALVSNGYIKNDAKSLNKIKYIDLRFGNKVNFELNK
jgi:cell division septal protein FtsQ